jgi:hypothetical protein
MDMGPSAEHDQIPRRCSDDAVMFVVSPIVGRDQSEEHLAHLSILLAYRY